MTSSGAICNFPFKLAENSNNVGCYWNSEYNNFMCPTRVSDEGLIKTQGICNNDCPGVNFINILCARFLNKRIFSSYILALAKKFAQKICMFNVDEIDGSRMQRKVLEMWK
jgi:hypothetical protein